MEDKIEKLKKSIKNLKNLYSFRLSEKEDILVSLQKCLDNKLVCLKKIPNGSEEKRLFRSYHRDYNVRQSQLDHCISHLRMRIFKMEKKLKQLEAS